MGLLSKLNWITLHPELFSLLVRSYSFDGIIFTRISVHTDITEMLWGSSMRQLTSGAFQWTLYLLSQ